ncbi:AAA family ATPase [Acidianus sp. RZ1]|uniref:AAA family ATPase n=1 Tax=Acidianus sp. RZ1 TaxID=1540082 RepID=UPI0014908CAD|nr:AAA family ATPase [Acidianus sp. RZ1]NON62076.1 ATP-binding protein [Acidianus sp. RZ1]
MIIRREKDIREINEAGWLIVYGRRKTGKSFLFHNIIDKFDNYYLVTRDRSVIDVVNNNRLSEEVLEQLLPLLLRERRTVIIDEFHRLPKRFFDFLQSISIDKKGRLILITSTLHFYKELLSVSSPILGVFSEKEIGLVDPVDTLKTTLTVSEGKEVVELAVALREPLTAEFAEKGNPLARTVYFKKDTVSALLGEIFLEEERRLTNAYYAILKAIADGDVLTPLSASHPASEVPAS